MARRFSCLVLGEEPLLAQCGDLLLSRGHAIRRVVTNAPPLRQWASSKLVPLLARAEVTSFMATAAQHEPVDLLLSITYPALIAPEAIAAARVGAFNYHDGPLPRYAGMNGSTWALLRGEKHHAVVWHRLTAGLDAGDIVARRDVELDARETSLSLNIQNAGLAFAAFEELIAALEEDRVVAVPQRADIERTEFSRHDRPDGLAVLDVTAGTAGVLDRLVRACDFGPFANRFAAPKLVHRGRAMIVREAHARAPHADESGEPGTILSVDDNELCVRCADGVLVVKRATTLGGAPLALASAALLLDLGPGDRVDHPPSHALQPFNRDLATREPAALKSLEASEALDLPLFSAEVSTGTEALTLAGPSDATDAESSARWLAAFAAALGALSSRDAVDVALVDERARARMLPAHSVLYPSVPLRFDVSADVTDRTLLARAREVMNASPHHAPFLFDLVARHPSVASRRAVAAGELSSAAVILEPAAVPSRSVLLSAHALPPGAAIALVLAPERPAELVVDRTRVSAARAATLADALRALYRKLAPADGTLLRAFDLLDDSERARIVGTFNATAQPFADELRIHDLFLQQVQRQPDATALVCDGATMTFAALDGRANQIAHVLRARGAGPGAYVAFCLDRGFDLVATMIAVAKTGAAYVPIDPSYPDDRVAFMLEDAKAVAVVTTRGLSSRIVHPHTVDLGSDEVARAPTAAVTSPARPSDVCYAIYTSGSTGKPKGVILTHRAVVNTLLWVNRSFQVTPDDRVLFVTSPSFDLSVFDTFGILGAGASLEIATSAVLREPRRLVERLTSGDITIWDSAPPALSRLVAFFPQEAPQAKLRLVMLSGDWIPVKLPDALRGLFRGCAVRSLGGATEAAIWSNFYNVETVDPAWTSIPYGRPIDNARYYILDRFMRPCPTGVPGDLYIGGVCLAEGYLNRAELTAERFVADPFVAGERIYKTGDLARFWSDGTMEFLGRADFQVKIRGFRVELGEVEAALLKDTRLREAVCVARVDPSGEKAIVAYVVPQSEQGAAAAADRVDAGELKTRLARTLPDFMVPSFVVVLERLPVTSNGKLDRAALPDPTARAADRVVEAPRTEMEQVLVTLWQEVLKTAPIGVTDDFFALGGHSLLAAMLVTRLKERLGKDVPLARILEHPTIRALAGKLDTASAAASAQAQRSHAVALRPEGKRAPLFLVAGIGGHVFTFRGVSRALSADQPVFAFQAIGAERGEVPRESVEEIAVSYASEIERLAPTGPLVLGGYSFGAYVAFELAQVLMRKGRSVDHLVFVDAWAPGFPRRLVGVERVRSHLSHLASRDNAGRRAYVAERVDNLRRRALFKVGLGHTLAPKEAGLAEADAERLRRLWALHTQAQNRYTPHGKLDVPLLLFKAAQQWDWPATDWSEPTLGWSTWMTEPVKVVTLPGRHVELFTDSNATTMARAIDDAMTRRNA